MGKLNIHQREKRYLKCVVASTIYSDRNETAQLIIRYLNRIQIKYEYYGSKCAYLK
jgi:hypothetical protein